MMDTDENRDSARTLENLFEVAATKSMESVDQLYAEEEMETFLHFIKAHPEQRSLAVQLFIDRISKKSPGVPSIFLMFCMYALRWPEIREFIERKKEEDIRQRGSARSGFWDDVLEAFRDDWDPAKYFREFQTP